MDAPEDEFGSARPVRRHRGITLRILAVLVLPLTMLLFVTIDDAVESAADADQERRTGESIERMDLLARLQMSIAAERLEVVLMDAVETDDTGTAGRILDEAGIPAIVEARETTDAALAAIGSQVPFDADDLADTRDLHDSGVEARFALARYDTHLADVADAMDAASFALIATSAGTGGAESAPALIRLTSSLAAHLASGDQVESLVHLLYAAGVEFELRRSDLSRTTQLAATAAEQADAFGPPLSLFESDVGARFDRLVDTALISDVPLARAGTISISELAAAVDDGLERRAELLDDTIGAARTALASAEDSKEESERSALRSFLAALAASVLSLAAGVYLARSVVRSLRVRDELERRLFLRATVDDLTGAVNRGPALERIDAALASGREVSVLFIDLDRFKDVNDRQGHPVGDEVLRIVARRLQQVTRSADTVARIGGDEFLVVMPDAYGIDEGLELGWRILDTLTRHYVVNGIQLELGASIGVASSVHAGNAGELLRSADLAVYAAKSTGRRVVAYTEEFNETVQAVNRTEQELRHGIGRGSQLALRYQPVVDAADGRVRAVEALVRWDRPGHGLVSPEDFVPVAERTRLVIELDVWVLHTALADLARIRESTGLHDLSLAVNASGMSVSDADFVARVRVALEAAGISPSALLVEVTETALVTDQARMAAHLRDIRALGVRVSIDDFGTGYTSISQLRTLPADVLKLDRSLLADAERAGDGLLPFVIEVAGRFGLRTVAEGIETAAQEAMARSLGIDELQGFGIAEPMSLPELLELLRRRDRLQATVQP